VYEALLELKRFLRQLRYGIPWRDGSSAYQHVPLLAIALSIGIGIATAGALWYVSPNFRFNPWVLVALVAPVVSGFYLTYLFDLLEIGLGWRGLELLVQIALGMLLLTPASDGLMAVSAGLIAVTAAWTTAVRLGSDLVPFRPDRLMPGHNGAQGELEHPGLQRFMRSQFSLLVALAGAAGFAARFQREAAPWWVSTVTGLGMALSMIAALRLLSWTHRAVLLKTWETQERFVQESVVPVWNVWTFRLAALAGGIGLALPANLSPLGNISFNSLFEAVNRYVSPFFVRSKTGRATTGGSTAAKIAEQAVRAETFSFTGIFNLLLYVALTVGVIWVLRRFWQLTRVRKEQQQSLAFGKDKGFWRWLWQTILGWFRRATEKLLESQVQEKSAGTKRGVRKYAPKKRVPTEPYALVLYLYARFLEKAASYRRHRKQYETAWEFRQRLLAGGAEQDAESITELTLLYQEVRYSSNQADTGIAHTFKSVWTAAVRALKRLKST
jgi:hypothetical protein